MKITILLYDKRPFKNSRIFKKYDYLGDGHIHKLLDRFKDFGLDIFIYSGSVGESDYKSNTPLASLIKRQQGYWVYDTRAWRAYYENHN